VAVSGQGDRSRVRAVQDFYAAIQNSRVTDVLALVHDQVGCFPLERNGMGRYSGHRGMIALIEDIHNTHGSYQHEISRIQERGSQVTVEAWILPEPESGQSSLSITTVFTFRDGLIDLIVSKPGPGAP
jgi:hypothetical protein